MGTVAVTSLYKSTSLVGTVAITTLSKSTSMVGTVVSTTLYKSTSMLIPRLKMRWADVDCQRKAYEVNVVAHVGKTYPFDLGTALYKTISVVGTVTNTVLYKLPPSREE